MDSKCPSCQVMLQRKYLKVDRIERYFSKTTPVYRCREYSSELIENHSKSRQDATLTVLSIVGVSTILVIAALWYFFHETKWRSAIMPLSIFSIPISNFLIRKLDKTPQDWPKWKIK